MTSLDSVVVLGDSGSGSFFSIKDLISGRARERSLIVFGSSKWGDYKDHERMKTRKGILKKVFW